MKEEITQEMIDAGETELRQSGLVDEPCGADALVVADIYRAMRASRPVIATTPAMIDAGMAVWVDYDPQHDDPKEFVARVYVYMEAARQQ